jgi:zinc transport system ATP-binding protein
MGYTPQKLKKTGLVGYLPQHNKINATFPVSVYDVVAFSRVAKKSIFQGINDEDRSIIKNSLARVEMTDFVNSHFGSLSGGQRQRVLIARALALQPKILILDEPSTGLDSVAQDSFYSLLTELRDEEKLTIVMVSHDVGAVSVIVDRVACLNRKIHFHGDPHKLSNKEREQIFGHNMNIVLHDEHCESCSHESAGADAEDGHHG